MLKPDAFIAVALFLFTNPLIDASVLCPDEARW
jgi:hypothetical protein